MGRAVYCLRLLACWDCGCESRRRHGCPPVIIAMRCQVKVPASGWSLVQRSPIECGVSECDSEASMMRRSWPNRGCCAMGRKLTSLILRYCTSVWLDELWETIRHFCQDSQLAYCTHTRPHTYTQKTHARTPFKIVICKTTDSMKQSSWCQVYSHSSDQVILKCFVLHEFSLPRSFFLFVITPSLQRLSSYFVLA